MTLDEAIMECNRIWNEREKALDLRLRNGIQGQLRDCLPDQYEEPMRSAMEQVMRERGYLRTLEQ